MEAKQIKVNMPIEALPFKQRLKMFEESEDLNKVSQLCSIAYLLHSIAQHLIEEEAEILNKYGLENFDIKHAFNTLSKAFDRYNRSLSDKINAIEKQRFCEDFDEMFDFVYSYMENREQVLHLINQVKELRNAE